MVSNAIVYCCKCYCRPKKTQWVIDRFNNKKEYNRSRSLVGTMVSPVITLTHNPYMYKRGNAHTIPVELSESNASRVNTSIEIHIFVVISYNQGNICRCCACCQWSTKQPQRSHHGIHLLSKLLFYNETRFRVQRVKFGVNCSAVSNLIL